MTLSCTFHFYSHLPPIPPASIIRFVIAESLSVHFICCSPSQPGIFCVQLLLSTAIHPTLHCFVILNLRKRCRFGVPVHQHQRSDKSNPFVGDKSYAAMLMMPLVGPPYIFQFGHCPMALFPLPRSNCLGLLNTTAHFCCARSYHVCFLSFPSAKWRNYSGVARHAVSHSSIISGSSSSSQQNFPHEI